MLQPPVNETLSEASGRRVPNRLLQGLDALAEKAIRQAGLPVTFWCRFAMSAK